MGLQDRPWNKTPQSMGAPAPPAPPKPNMAQRWQQIQSNRSAAQQTQDPVQSLQDKYAALKGYGGLAVQGAKAIGGALKAIPFFAEGGMVDEPTVAMIGEAGPEAVIPLDESDDDIQKRIAKDRALAMGTPESQQQLSAARDALESRNPNYIPEAPSKKRQVFGTVAGILGGRHGEQLQQAIMYPGLAQKKAAYDAETSRLKNAYDLEHDAQADDLNRLARVQGFETLAANEQNRMENRNQMRDNSMRQFHAAGGQFIPTVNPTPEGFIDVPEVKAPQGMRAVQYTPEEGARRKATAEAEAKKKVEETGYLTVTPDLAAAVPELGMKGGERVSATVYNNIVDAAKVKKANPQVEIATDEVKGILRGLDKVTGRVLWESQPGISVKRPPAAQSTTVINGTDLNTKDRAVFNTLVDRSMKSPLIAASDRTIVLKNTIDNIRKDPGNAAQQNALAYAYVQALDTYQSAVREGELRNVTTIDSKIGQLQNAIQQMTNGQIMRPEVAMQVADAADALRQAIGQGARAKEAQFESQARQNGTAVYNAWLDYRKGFSASYDQPKPNTALPGGVTLDEVNAEIERRKAGKK